MTNNDNSAVDFEKRCKELEEALAFAEKGWRDASQANFLLNSQYADKIKKLTEELEVKNNELRIYKDAYESVVNSKTWKMSVKVKKLMGKKVN